MKIFQPLFVQKYRHKVVNIHPSLLPAFPGIHSVSNALAYRTKITGITVHFVEEGIDTGPIIAQIPVPVFDDDDEISLHRRIQIEEHKIYSQVVRSVAEDLTQVDNRKVVITPLKKR